MEEVLKKELQEIRTICIDVKNNLNWGKTQKSVRKSDAEKLEKLLKIIEGIGWRYHHKEASRKDADGNTNDSYETLKQIISIFENAPSVKSGLYTAQDRIFGRHPELEDDGGEIKT